MLIPLLILPFSLFILSVPKYQLEDINIIKINPAAPLLAYQIRLDVNDGGDAFPYACHCHHHPCRASLNSGHTGRFQLNKNPEFSTFIQFIKIIRASENVVGWFATIEQIDFWVNKKQEKTTAQWWISPFFSRSMPLFFFGLFLYYNGVHRARDEEDVLSQGIAIIQTVGIGYWNSIKFNCMSPPWQKSVFSCIRLQLQRIERREEDLKSFAGSTCANLSGSDDGGGAKSINDGVFF